MPIVLVAIGLSAVLVPESRASRSRRADPVGQILMLVMLVGLVYAIVEAADKGWGSQPILAALAASAVATAGLLVYEPRRAESLLEVRLFRSAPLSSAILIAITGLGAFGAFLFVTTFDLQSIRHLSATNAGLSLLPAGLLIAVLGTISGRWVAHHGPRLPLIVAGASIALAGTGLLTQPRTHHWRC